MNERQSSDSRSDDGLDDLLDVGLRIHFGDDESTSVVTGRPLAPAEPWSGHPVIERLAAEGRYEPAETLGQGGMGFVIAVEDRLARRRVALKIARPFAIENRLTLASLFIDEARVAAGLDHPSIPAVYDVGVVDEIHPWFTMPIIEGRSFSEILRATPPGSSRTPLLAIVRRVAQAVSYAHTRGVIHGDLKPSNVMVTEEGEVYVVDWGLSRIDRHGPTAAVMDESVRTGAAGIGTPAYMAPEQARGEIRHIGPRTDVFNLGALLYEALLGDAPYAHVDLGRRSEAAAKGDLAPALLRLDALREHADHAGVIRACLASDPADRPADCTIVAAELARLEREALESARRLTIELETTRVAVEHGRRVRRALWALIAVLIVGAISMVQWVRLRAREDIERERRTSRVHELTNRAATTRIATAGENTDHRIDLLTRVAADLSSALEISGDDVSIDTARTRSELAIVDAEVDSLRRRRDIEVRTDREREHLEDIRRRVLGGERMKDLDHDFESFFAGLGIRPDEDVEVAAESISEHALARELREALGDWCLVRRGLHDGSAAAAARLSSLLDALEDGPSALATVLLSPTLAGKEAAAALDRLVATSVPTSLHLAAHDILTAGRRDDARRLYEAALAVHPDDHWLNYGFGCLLYDEGNDASFDRAIVHFTAAATSAPEEARAWASLGATLSRRGRMDEAERALRRALDIEPTNRWAHFSLAVVFKNEGRLKDALAELDAADLGGSTSPYWSARHRAEIHVQAGDFAMALDVLEAARSTYPNDDALFGLEMKALRASDQKERAHDLAVEFARRRPSSVLAHQESGRALEESRDRDGAEAAYRRALALDPDNGWTCLRLAALLSVDSDTDDEAEVSSLVECAVTRMPQSMEARHLHGLAHERAGRMVEALRDYRHALELSPPSSTGRSSLERHVARAVDLVRLDERSTAASIGDFAPKSPEEWRGLIRFASDHRLWRREAALRRARSKSMPIASPDAHGEEEVDFAKCLVRSMSPACNDRRALAEVEIEPRLVEAADALERGAARLESALADGAIDESVAQRIAGSWLLDPEIALLRPSAARIDPPPYARPETWELIEKLATNDSRR